MKRGSHRHCDYNMGTFRSGFTRFEGDLDNRKAYMDVLCVVWCKLKTWWEASRPECPSFQSTSRHEMTCVGYRIQPSLYPADSALVVRVMLPPKSISGKKPHLYGAVGDGDADITIAQCLAGSNQHNASANSIA